MTATEPNALVRLRNGGVAPASAVRTTWLTLKALTDSGNMMEGVIALYEARELARDPCHALWPGTFETLRKLALLGDSGIMHQITRDVILSAVTGEEMDLSITWPIEASDNRGKP